MFSYGSNRCSVGSGCSKVLYDGGVTCRVGVVGDGRSYGGEVCVRLCSCAALVDRFAETAVADVG